VAVSALGIPPLQANALVDERRQQIVDYLRTTF
jgi:hypothetical protein